MAMSAIPTADPQVTTIGQLLALPEDDLRHELLQGVHVVTPAPSGRSESRAERGQTARPPDRLTA